MIELSKHIEILLLKHNCVIVPQLGGFIAQDVPARYVAEENLFLPPHRTVGFNPQLTLNDGLLVQSYMQAYDTSYPETIELIEQAVSNLKAEIMETGSFELSGIGKLTLNLDGQYNFEPNEAGILSPSLYGLDAVVVKPVNEQLKVQAKPSVFATKTKEVHKNPKNYTFSINKELVNYVAAAVVAIVFYFLWATPLSDSSTMSAQQASMLFPYHIQHVKQEVPEFIPSAEMAETDSTTVETSVAEVPETEAEEPEAPILEEETDDSYYTIVLVSCIPLKNAEAFVQEMTDEGYKEVSVLQKRHLVRVVTGKFATESEAHNELRTLRKTSDRFGEAWILNVK